MEEKIIIGENTQYPLEGILTIPENAEGKVPAAVFVHGSGASDKDEKVGKITMFKDLAEALAEKGIASLRYDKRTFVHGRKMVKQGGITIREETIEDAVLAAEILKQDPRIDAERVFIIGHSMGGCLTGRIDAEGGDFRGLIIMAGSLHSLDEILLRQLTEQAQCSGFILRFILNRVRSSFEKKFTAMKSMSDAEAMNTKVGRGATLYYFKEMADHPAAGYLENCQKPMLIMQGSADLQVSLKSDYEGFRRLLGDRSNVTFRLYEGLNHAFVKALYDNPAKAGKEFAAERHVPAEVSDDIAAWIHSCR